MYFIKLPITDYTTKNKKSKKHFERNRDVSGLKA